MVGLHQTLAVKKFRRLVWYGARRVVGLHQTLAGNVITCLEPLLHCECCFKFWPCGVVITLNTLGLTVTEISIKKVQKQNL